MTARWKHGTYVSTVAMHRMNNGRMNNGPLNTGQIDDDQTNNDRRKPN